MAKFHIRAAMTLALAGGAYSIAPLAQAAAYLQCAPFARNESGIALYGRAADWWGQAAGKFARGNEPQVGAVLAMPGTRAMPGGHVAVVSRILGEREILITHANWSPINGRRGQIERNVRAVDVSAAGDWSAVRIWYAPIRDLGLRASPAHGFIYANGPRAAPDAYTPQFGRDWQPGNGLGDIVATLAVNQ